MTKPRLRPSFASPETALLIVPFRRTAGISMAFSGTAVLAISLHYLLPWRGIGMASIIPLAFALMGLFFVGGGILTATRREPALTADATGVTATCSGFDRSRIRWHMISGITVVGRKRNDKSLVILTHDPEAWFSCADPSLVSHTKKMNRKHSLPGALYILGRIMRRSPEAVALELQDLLELQRLEQHDEEVDHDLDELQHNDSPSPA